MTAEAPDGFTAFAAWAAGIGLEDQGALLAGLAVGALGRPDGLVAVTRRGETRYFQVAGRLLSHVSEAASARRPDLTIRDYRGLRLGMVALGEAATPTVSLGDAADRLTLTFECDPRDMSSDQCVAFLSAFAGRLDEPMRHLL